ncbi:MAG: 50S ribosomal protein L29 [Opitutae bacterium]|jgi:large subunit ribosomal protein L29|uniref:50S ribosomal protein L29 n=1 Tax=unclassified Lentimonas TaxID=2630993 RepID=UPI000E9C6ED7|nr:MULTISPECIES: 50S ribosomal protein L29 [unclassified Lentimonas]MBT4757920.1 50S ribosomal protein L29 [Opitutae bacterium]MDG1242264.1 50S ribosomal protein L29 [Opitutae bacterium]MDG1300356.1 50S ribosomal protein L29 [Opitutae bacterium]CAA6677482.1 LSU ribosomal protein L29p (L35e) [Lentimonas sp. CC4]CAA6686452.1 LSU ribosomal protein L29p (L35e) [Lentimonas sp. CC6]
MSTTKDIREMSEVEIEKKLRDTHDAHVNLRLRKQTGQVERPHEFTQLRREIARLETILKEKKLAAASA